MIKPKRIKNVVSDTYIFVDSEIIENLLLNCDTYLITVLKIELDRNLFYVYLKRKLA